MYEIVVDKKSLERIALFNAILEISSDLLKLAALKYFVA